MCGCVLSAWFYNSLCLHNFPVNHIFYSVQMRIYISQSASDNRPQNVEAYVAFEVNVRMVNLCITTNFWRFVWICLTDDETEYKLASSVDALLSLTHKNNAVYCIIMHRDSHINRVQQIIFTKCYFSLQYNKMLVSWMKLKETRAQQLLSSPTTAINKMNY